MSGGGVPGPFRPGGPVRPTPTSSPVARPAEPAPASGSGHPAVDAVIQAIANATDLPPADQIAQFEAAHRTLQETLATIDQA